MKSIVCQYGPSGSKKPVFGTPFLYARWNPVLVVIQRKFVTIYSKVFNKYYYMHSNVMNIYNRCHTSRHSNFC